ncbi:hypothetical protein DSUL_140025 [Desulfovibrionales bacterium]
MDCSCERQNMVIKSLNSYLDNQYELFRAIIIDEGSVMLTITVQDLMI